MKDRAIYFPLFILGMLGLLLGFAWTVPEAGICGATIVDDAIQTTGKDVALNCFEFWLNRYQSLIGAAMTLLAAVIAAVWVAKQVQRADEQIKLTTAQMPFMRQQGAAVRLNTLVDTLDFYDDVEVFISKYDEYAHGVVQGKAFHTPAKSFHIVRQILGEVENKRAFDENGLVTGYIIGNAAEAVDRISEVSDAGRKLSPAIKKILSRSRRYAIPERMAADLYQIESLLSSFEVFKNAPIEFCTHLMAGDKNLAMMLAPFIKATADHRLSVETFNIKIEILAMRQNISGAIKQINSDMVVGN